jgi:transcriptional antiterminator RfaH
VLHTKPRQELRAQNNLQAWGLETLLPRLPRRKTCRDTFQALFPSYIFCRFPAPLFDKVKFTYGISYILSFGGMPAVVDEEIIRTLRERMDPDGTVLIQAPPALERGDHVVIQSGPFRNLVGVFEREMPGSERVRILLDTVNFKASVEVGKADVAKV